MVEPATAAMANGVSPAARSRATASATARAAQVEVVVGGQDDEGVGREAELVERAGDREVGLVAGVDPGALEVLAARRPAKPAEPPEVQVAGQGHAP